MTSEQPQQGLGLREEKESKQKPYRKADKTEHKVKSLLFLGLNLNHRSRTAFCGNEIVEVIK